MNEVSETNHIIVAADNFPLAATVFSASSASNRVIVFASGLGVPRYAYFKFARYLASKGYKVITFDYRGIFESQDSAFLPSQMKMEEWGKKDIEAVLKFAQNELNAVELYYCAHSAGGQLIGLAPSCVHLDAIVFLSVNTGYWKLWPWHLKWMILLFWYFIPVITWNRETFPAKFVGFSTIDIPSGVTRQWSRWGRSHNYIFDHILPEEISRYAGLDIPLLALSFDDDTTLGPKPAIDELLTHFNNVKLTRRHIYPSEYSQSKIGHFGFFRKEFESSLWKEVLQWLNDQST